MSAITFDTLAITKRLKSHGFSEAQAEAITQEMQYVHDISLEQLATKGDIKDCEFRMTNAIKDMQLKLGAMIVGLGAFLAAIKFFG